MIEEFENERSLKIFYSLIESIIVNSITSIINFNKH